jgi:carboxymethylenebutenolidase
MAHRDEITIPTPDGQRMPGLAFVPESGRGAGLVLVQEIFGLTPYIESRASDLAGLGYVVVVPELYWRLGEHLVTDETTEEGLQQAFGYFQRLDLPRAAQDCSAAVDYLRGRPETGGRAGILGFCLGGRLAYEVGVLDAPDVVVAYYGSGIADRLDDAPRLTCPVLFQFGGADPYLPTEQSERIAAAFAGRPDVEAHTHAGAGHAFDNFRAPLFSVPAAAAAAWPQTVDFLGRTFPS